MFMTLTVISAAIFLLAILFALLIAGKSGRSLGWQSTVNSRLLLLMVVLILLAAKIVLHFWSPPSYNSSFGWGILLGGAAALLASLMSAVQANAERHAGAAIGMLALAGLATCVVMLLYRNSADDALIGCAIGAVTAGAIMCSALRMMAPAFSPPTFRGVEIFTIASLALVAGVRLGMLHFPGAAHSEVAGYWTFPLLMLATGLVGIILFSSDRAGSFLQHYSWFSTVIAGILMVILTLLLQRQLLPKLDWQLPLYGLSAFGLVMALLFKEERQSDVEHFRPLALSFGLILFSLAVVTLGFRKLGGYGEALVIIPALLLVSGAYMRANYELRPVSSSLGVAALCLLLLLTVSRLLISTNDAASTLDFQRQYDLLSLLIGVAASWGITAYLSQGNLRSEMMLQQGKSPVFSSLVYSKLLWLVVALSPLVILIFFGIRSALAFLIGLAVGEICWLVLVAWSNGKERLQAILSAPHSMLITAMVTAITFAPLLLAVELRRSQRLTLVLIFCSLAIIWVLIDTIPRLRDNKEAADHA